MTFYSNFPVCRTGGRFRVLARDRRVYAACGSGVERSRVRAALLPARALGADHLLRAARSRLPCASRSVPYAYKSYKQLCRTGV